MGELSRKSARLPEDGRGPGRRAQFPEGERGPQPTERDETVHPHETLAGAAEPAGTCKRCAGNGLEPWTVWQCSLCRGTGVHYG